MSRRAKKPTAAMLDKSYAIRKASEASRKQPRWKRQLTALKSAKISRERKGV